MFRSKSHAWKTQAKASQSYVAAEIKKNGDFARCANSDPHKLS